MGIKKRSERLDFRLTPEEKLKVTIAAALARRSVTSLFIEWVETLDTTVPQARIPQKHNPEKK